jgi:hypothetical protein
MKERIPPELLVPGTSVLCYTDSSLWWPDVRQTTIKKVSTRSFTVNDDREPRFPLDGRGVAQGSGYSFRHVVLLDSAKARRLLAVALQHQQHNTARDAVDVWLRTSNHTNRQALIAALVAIDKDLEDS